MKKTKIALVFLVAALGFSGAASAALTKIGMATYQGGIYHLIYDDVQSLVWLGYTNDMDSWQNQMDWADGMNGPGVLNSIISPRIKLTYDVGKGGWRLPITDESKANLNGGYGFQGPDETGYHNYALGFNMVNSELGHLFYKSLGNLGLVDTSGNQRQSGWGLKNIGPFYKFIEEDYWSGTMHSLKPDAAWAFSPRIGMTYDVGVGELKFAMSVLPATVSIAPPPNQLLISFAQGLFSCSSKGCYKLHPLGPELMTRVDIDADGWDDLVFGYPGYGTYILDEENGSWEQINRESPRKMIAWGTGLVCDFGIEGGLHHYCKDHGWSRLSYNQYADRMTVVGPDIKGGYFLVVSFSGYGTYVWDKWNGDCLQISTLTPRKMIPFGTGVLVDFETYGLWLWTKEGGWSLLNTIAPELMMAGDEMFAASFSGYGTYVKQWSGPWMQINPLPAQAIIPFGDGFALNYEGYGSYSWKPGDEWRQISRTDPDEMLTMDFNDDGKEELVQIKSSVPLKVREVCLEPGTMDYARFFKMQATTEDTFTLFGDSSESLFKIVFSMDSSQR